tara:strand:+ start:10862 stop:11167 length:306 start_codon:yes stop_codon:yes gene_type:complete
MLNIVVLIIIIIMVAIILLPFNNKFWIYINKDNVSKITNVINYSDYELDLYSLIADYQSGVIDEKEFDEKLNSFNEFIKESSMDKLTITRIEQALEDVKSN